MVKECGKPRITNVVMNVVNPPHSFTSGEQLRVCQKTRESVIVTLLYNIATATHHDFTTDTSGATRKDLLHSQYYSQRFHHSGKRTQRDHEITHTTSSSDATSRH